MNTRIPILILLVATLSLRSGLSQQPKFSPDYMQALMTGDVETLKRIISKNPEWVNQYRLGPNPPIVQVAQSGKTEAVELLITNKADINAHGVWGRTALHFAAIDGDAKMVEILLKDGADVNAVDENGFTPIVQSIRSVEVLKLLLAHGADINAHGGKNTLYSQAIGHSENAGPGVIDFILTNGVDVTVSGDEGFYQAVLFYNDTNLVKRLVPFYAKSTKAAGMSLLHGAMEIAMDNGRIEMASAIASACIALQTNSLQKAVAQRDDSNVSSILVTNPASANRKDFFGWTALHLASILGKERIAEALLSNNAGVDSQDDIGNTPLHWAVFFGHREVVAQLLQRNANMEIRGNTEINTLGSGHDTPLDLAVFRGFNSIATMLITNGADLGPHNWWGASPLHSATAGGNLELMRLLISRGAKVNGVRGANYKQTPLDIAVTGDVPEAVRLLLASGASLQTQMRTHSGGKSTLFHLWADGHGNTNIADQLLAAGCDLNATNGEGATPLHIAVGKWDFSYKPNPNRTNTSAQWPADYIMEDSGKDAAWWLLSHNAKANAKDKNGRTPLHLIVTRGNLKAIQALLDSGVDVNATDSDGKTALALLEDLKVMEYNFSHGIRVDFKAVEKLLLDHGAKGPILSAAPGPRSRF